MGQGVQLSLHDAPQVTRADYNQRDDGRVTQVAFVDDRPAGRVTRPSTSDELQWQDRRSPRQSTGTTRTNRSSTTSTALNAPQRATYQTSFSEHSSPPAVHVDEDGMRWRAPNREQRIQSTREPLDPFINPLERQTIREPLPQRHPATAPRTVPVQTEIPQPKFSADVGLLQEDVPCDRKYNGRNCCVGDRDCRDARERFADLTVRNIDLDITPMLNPTTAREVLDSPGERGLPDASRTWRNRDGAVIAEGVLADFTNGRVRIETADGRQISVHNRELSDDDRCYFAAWWGVPTECALSDVTYQGRHWLPMTMTWKASAICHNPLYFEEVQLERYGHSAGPITQPVLSGAHFFFNIAALPYKMGIHPMNECMYPLGTYREGNCAPWLVPPVPISLRGGLMEAGVITGGVFILP